MAGREFVGVRGLAQFRRALRVLDKDAAKGLRRALNEAAEVVVSQARTLVPLRSGRARASIKTRSSQTAVRVAIGGKKAPYYPWLDFGGKVGPRDSVHRPFLKNGRYLYPTLDANRDEFRTVLTQRITEVARQAGLDVD